MFAHPFASVMMDSPVTGQRPFNPLS